MKRLIMVFMLLLFMAGLAYAQGTTVDVGIALGTEPEGDFGSAWGPMAGVSLDFGTFVNVSEGSNFKPYSENIRFRADIAYFKWDDKEQGVDIEYRRLPIFIGARYFFPTSKLKHGISVFAEAGGEISFDKAEAAACGGGTCRRVDDKDTNFGLAVGGGLVFPFSESVQLTVSGRRHEITDSFFTFTAAVGFNF